MINQAECRRALVPTHLFKTARSKPMCSVAIDSSCRASHLSMSSGPPSFKPKLHRTQSFAVGRESAVSPGASEGTGYDSERHAPTIRDIRAIEAALQCSQLELQVANSALAVVVRALRRSQKINSELRAPYSREFWQLAVTQLT